MCFDVHVFQSVQCLWIHLVTTLNYWTSFDSLFLILCVGRRGRVGNTRDFGVTKDVGSNRENRCSSYHHQ